MATTTATTICILALGLTRLSSGFSNIGTHFFVTFPPTSTGSQDGDCYLHINAFQQTVVSIISERTGELDSFTVFPPTPAIRVIECAERVPSGHSNRLLRIIAQGAVTVQLETTNGRQGDMITLFPELNNGLVLYKYYLKSLIQDSCTSSDYNAVFYLVSNYENEIIVWDAPIGGNIVDSFTMGALSTYADYRLCNSNHDFTGWGVTSTSPIHVVSGTLNTRMYSSYDDTSLNMVLDVTLRTNEYVIPPITRSRSSSSSDGYFIRIISFDYDNLLAIFDRLNVPIFGKYLTVNEVYTYTVPDGRDAHIVRCTFDCIVHAYPRRTRTSSGGQFAYQQPSSQRGTDMAIFNKISTYAVLTIVANTMSISYNGNTISSWVEMEGNNLYYAIIALSSSTNPTSTLSVTADEDGGSFQCYLHGEISTSDWYGDIVGVGGIPLNPEGKTIISDERLESVKDELSLEW